MAAMLDFLSRRDYGGIPSGDLRGAVLSYLGETDTVVGEDVNLVKRLSKALSLVLREDPRVLDGHLDKIIKFHEEALADLKDSSGEAHSSGKVYDRFEHLCDKETQRMSYILPGHFAAHLALFEERKADVEGDVNARVSAYNHTLQAAQLVAHLEPDFARELYWDAALRAYRVFEENKDAKWFRKYVDKAHAAVSLGYMTDRDRARHCKRLLWTRVDNGFNKKDKGTAVIGEQKYEWLRLRLDKKVRNREEEAYTLACMLDTLAGDLYDCTRRQPWLEERYHARVRALEIVEGVRPKQAAHSQLFAGDRAKAYAENVGGLPTKKKWARTAVEHYKAFIAYAEAHESHFDAGLVGSVGGRIRRLQREILSPSRGRSGRSGGYRR